MATYLDRSFFVLHFLLMEVLFLSDIILKSSNSSLYLSGPIL